MPTSDVHNIVPIVTTIQKLQPRSILDIGCGFGKYGVLLREYLDIWNERLQPASWQVRLVGIDTFPQYRTPIWDYVYQKIMIGKAEDLVPHLGPFDVVLIADVIEHLERPAAVKLVKDCLDISPVLVLSTPQDFYPQQSSSGNPLEIHRILWTTADFPVSCHVQTITGLACNTYVASRAPLHWEVTYLADLRNVLYLRSRHKLRWLGPLGWALASLSRLLNRGLA